MPSKPTAAGHRISPAELPPELRARYEKLKTKAQADRHLEGPPPPVADHADAAPFYFELRAFVKQLRDAREAAGLTLAQVAEASGLAEETVSRLETGALTNPTWKTLGLVARAVGLRPRLATEPLPSE